VDKRLPNTWEPNFLSSCFFVFNSELSFPFLPPKSNSKSSTDTRIIQSEVPEYPGPLALYLVLNRQMGPIQGSVTQCP
jgi:hypothetical protein